MVKKRFQLGWHRWAICTILPIGLLRNWYTGTNATGTLVQFSLARGSHIDPIDVPRAAVILAEKVSVVMVVAALTIYGTLL